VVARVLVVEDERDVADLVRDVLELEGYATSVALGDTAMREALTFRPDVVLLDLMMPGIDGFEVARLMRENPETRTIPIVVMTAMHDPAGRASQIGAAGYVAKPFDIGELLATIETTVS
jgi:DNA-binding response OmpR family regulator